MFKIKYKFLFVYNVVFNAIGFCMLFPAELGGVTLHAEETAQLEVSALFKASDQCLPEFSRLAGNGRLSVSLPIEGFENGEKGYREAAVSCLGCFKVDPPQKPANDCIHREAALRCIL